MYDNKVIVLNTKGVNKPYATIKQYEEFTSDTVKIKSSYKIHRQRKMERKYIKIDKEKDIDRKTEKNMSRERQKKRYIKR